MTSLTVTSPHRSVGRVLDLKTRACGFDSRAGLLNNWITNVFRMRKPRSRVTMVYTKHVKEPDGALGSFVLYPYTIPRNNYPSSERSLSDGQPVANKQTNRVFQCFIPVEQHLIPWHSPHAEVKVNACCVHLHLLESQFSFICSNIVPFPKVLQVRLDMWILFVQICLKLSNTWLVSYHIHINWYLFILSYEMTGFSEEVFHMLTDMTSARSWI